MQSIDLIRDNLAKSTERVLARIEDMRAHAVVYPTANGGGHTLWVLGHLAYIEGLVVQDFLRGERNPLAAWEPLFDGDDVSGELDAYPPFDELLAECREVRAGTVAMLAGLDEADLDCASAYVPKGLEETFGTFRLGLQYLADHWYMHRGQLADARRSAGMGRMWL